MNICKTSDNACTKQRLRYVPKVSHICSKLHEKYSQNAHQILPKCLQMPPLDPIWTTSPKKAAKVMILCAGARLPSTLFTLAVQATSMFLLICVSIDPCEPSRSRLRRSAFFGRSGGAALRAAFGSRAVDVAHLDLKLHSWSRGFQARLERPRERCKAGLRRDRECCRS